MKDAKIEEAIKHTISQSAKPLPASDIAKAIAIDKSTVNAHLYRKIDLVYKKNTKNHTWTLTSKIDSTGNTVTPQGDGGKLVEVLFSPGDDPIEEICRLISESTISIYIQAYYLRSERLAKALKSVKKNKGIPISILLGCTSTSRKISRDTEIRHGGNKNPILLDLHKRKIIISQDYGDTNNHNKCIVVDEKTSITGGMNLCDFAEQNADNIVIIRNHEIAKSFISNWKYNDKKFGEPFEE